MSNTNDFILQNPTPNLPEELIIINILPKLPIKSLLRFKIVSKKWNFSISSPYFAKLHFNQSSNNKNQHFLINHKTCFLSFDYENFEQNHENGEQKTWDCSPFNEEGDIISTNKNCVARVLKSDFHLPNSNIFAIGSCNGLVCLHNAKSSNSLYLWNPTILALREIPYPESNPNPKRNNSSCLDAVWGFGYVSSTDDYKIVRLYQNKSNNNVIEIQIFSTINNNWKSLQETCEDNWSFFGLKNRIGTYADNAIYWAYNMKVLNQSRQNYDYKEWCIFGFDLVAKKLMKVPLPESTSTGFEYPPLMYATMDGNLGACWNIAYNVGEIGMFIKDEGIGKWKNVNGSGKYWIYKHFKNFSILGMTKKGRFILYVDHFRYNMRFGKKHASCEFITYTNEEDLILDLKLKCPLGSKNVIPYVESLLSPFG